MIKTNLAVLMAERGLKISDIYEATGISKTTLMAISDNTGKGIQYETMDKLCNYLGVTPSEFFVYFPYSINFDSILKYDEFDTGFYINCFLKKESWESSENIQFSINQTSLINELIGYDRNFDKYDFSLYVECSPLKNLFKKMPIQFKRSVELEMIESIFKAISNADVSKFEEIGSYDAPTVDFIKKLNSRKDGESTAFIALNFEDNSTLFMETKVKIKKHKLLLK